jgi:hypothetical protein
VVGYRLVKRLRGATKSAVSSTSEATSSYVHLPGYINTLFYRILFLESLLLRYINLPFGTSVMVVAEQETKKGRL